MQGRNERRPIRNLYQLRVEGDAGVEAKIREAVHRPTTEDDTHPSPADRFRHARRITQRAQPPISGLVWDLFVNRESLTRELSQVLHAQVSEAL